MNSGLQVERELTAEEQVELFETTLRSPLLDPIDTEFVDKYLQQQTDANELLCKLPKADSVREVCQRFLCSLHSFCTHDKVLAQTNLEAAAEQ